MSKTLTNQQYYDTVIKPSHKPVSREIGSQRDPEYIVVCSCMSYQEKIAYQDHLVGLLNKEFNFFDERYGLKSYDR